MRRSDEPSWREWLTLVVEILLIVYISWRMTDLLDATIAYLEAHAQKP